MSRASIETRDIVKGLVIIDTDRKNEIVKIFVRESLNETITSETEVTVSTEMFSDLIASAYESLGRRIIEVEEVI